MEHTCVQAASQLLEGESSWAKGAEEEDLQADAPSFCSRVLLGAKRPEQGLGQALIPDQAGSSPALGPRQPEPHRAQGRCACQRAAACPAVLLPPIPARTVAGAVRISQLCRQPH